MTSADTEERHSDRFVKWIVEHCLRDRGQRAALRRGLRRPPEQAHTMHALIAPLLPPRVTEDREYAYYAVAAMIAASIRDRQDADLNGEASDLDDAEELIAPGSGDGPATRPDLGASLAWAVCRPGPGRRPMNRATAEKRLHLLVRQSYPAVYQHLVGVVRHLSAVDVQVSWGQLIDDLCKWRHGRDLVAKRWLQSYYRTLHEADRRAEQQKLSLKEPA